MTSPSGTVNFVSLESQCFSQLSLRRCQGGGGGSHVARLNFKTSRVGVYKCFTSLSEF